MNRDEILCEMGLTPIWRLRHPSTGSAPARAWAEPIAGVVSEIPPLTSPQAAAADSPALATQEPAAVPAVTAALWPEAGSAASEALPVDEFRPAVLDEAPEPGCSETASAVPMAVSGGIGVGPERQGQIAALDWTALANAVGECRACGLCRQRKQAVFGVGDARPDWLFIGEGPGEQEDLRGEPFVGVAGQLLDAMLAAIALKRGDKVYIANAVKCRPPGNRTPSPEEIAACRPFLMRQIALMQPKLIVLLGRAAVHAVLDVETSLAGLRGRVHQFGRTPVVVTYHPAYLLRTLPEKAKAWEDLCLARRVLRDSGVEAA